MRNCSLLMVPCCVLAGQLWAQPIYTHTAFVFFGTWTPQDITNFVVAGPGFNVQNGVNFGSTAFRVGEAVPLNFAFGADPTGISGNVDYGGIVVPSFLGGVVNQTTDASFVLPPNPNATYTFPARATGQLTAFPAACFFPPPTCPPPGAEANLLVNLAGQLTVTLTLSSPSGFYTVTEQLLATTPIPEPSTIALLALGIGMAGAYFACFKSRRRRS